jgi:hypothetical protein
MVRIVAKMVAARTRTIVLTVDAQPTKPLSSSGSRRRRIQSGTVRRPVAIVDGF